MSDNATFFTDIAAEVEMPPNGTLSRALCKDERVRLVASLSTPVKSQPSTLRRYRLGHRSFGVAPPDAGN